MGTSIAEELSCADVTESLLGWPRNTALPTLTKHARASAPMSARTGAANALTLQSNVALAVAPRSKAR
jgi:hypothetical protein